MSQLPSTEPLLVTTTERPAGYEVTQALGQVFGVDAIGFGQWFRYLTGGVEVVGAVRLPLPAAGFASASLLTATVLAVVATHPFLSAAA